MFHPLQEDVQTLDDQTLEKKLAELNKKYVQAARIGNHSLLTQLATFVTIYREETSRRYQEKLQQSQKNIDGLINVD